ncbi:MAG: type transport system ATP-binding protein [Micromonosporaceae bacterium]|nr:type transport system ATP-binding protein [Micromonosporaceae bacterium]
MRIDDGWLRYGRRAPWVLREVSLSLSAGETAVLVGRNGAGKSTLLRALVGTLVPARGAIRGRPVPIGWVPERFPPDQPFTVLDYLTHMGTVRGLARSPARSAAGNWADRLQLTPHLGVRLPALSKGTAQKVGLAQALLVEPRLLVLDEPTEGLDAAVLADVPQIIAEVTATGGMVVVSDHSGKLGDLPGCRRWLAADGRVVAVEPLGDRYGPVELGRPTSGHAGIRCVIEVATAADRATAAVAHLRSVGYDVLGVREEPVAPGAVP